jgi:beta-lactamase class C
VFRWASVSKGVAGTMVAKLAEQGKVKLDAPVVNYAPGLKLPAATNIAPASPTCSATGWACTATRSTTSWRKGSRRSCCAPSWRPSTPSARRTPAGPTRTSPSTRQRHGRAGDRQPYQEAVRQQLFAPLGMTSASMTREGLVSAKLGAAAQRGRRPLEVLEPYYRVPAAGGVNSNIKDLSLWMIAQMGGMPACSPAAAETIHAPLVKTPGERGRLRKFLERVGDAWYGWAGGPTIMPGTGSSATAAGSTATAR